MLRSTSSPALSPRAPGQKPSVSRAAFTTRTVLARSISASPTAAKLTRALSDGNLKKLLGTPTPERMTSSVYFERASSHVLDEPGFGGGWGSFVGGGGGCCGGGGGNSGGEEGREESVDGYYEDMIKRYPGDALLLANYARYLKEVKGDERKAEEYCERAMLEEKGKDGNLLSMYGDLIWTNHRDSVRAQFYFDQAVQSSPHDCYVLASYARFLWEAEDDDEEGEDDEIEYRTDLSPSYVSVSVVS